MESAKAFCLLQLHYFVLTMFSCPVGIAQWPVMFLRSLQSHNNNLFYSYVANYIIYKSYV